MGWHRSTVPTNRTADNTQRDHHPLMIRSLHQMHTAGGHHGRCGEPLLQFYNTRSACFSVLERLFTIKIYTNCRYCISARTNIVTLKICRGRHWNYHGNSWSKLFRRSQPRDLCGWQCTYRVFSAHNNRIPYSLLLTPRISKECKIARTPPFGILMSRS